MPIKKSARKALRQSRKRTVKNREIKENIKSSIRELNQKIAAKDKTAASDFMSKVSKTVDKAAKNNVIHKNTAARIKSRMQKAINKLT